MSPRPSRENPLPAAKSRGKVTLMGASRLVATVTITSAPKTALEPKTHLRGEGEAERSALEVPIPKLPWATHQIS